MDTTLQNTQSSAFSNISVIEDELLSRNSSFFQRRDKEPSLLQPAAEQKRDWEWYDTGAQYVIFPTTVAGIVWSYDTAFESKCATCTYMIVLPYVAYSKVYKINSVVFSVTAGTETSVATNDMALFKKRTTCGVGLYHGSLFVLQTRLIWPYIIIIIIIIIARNVRGPNF